MMQTVARDTRADLLAEAEILVRSRGYSGFSYADLADAVGIRKASIHHHFPTKTDLAVALLAAYGERYKTAIGAIMATSDNGLDRVNAYAELYLQGVEKGLGCLCAALAAERDIIPERLRADLARFFEDHIAWLERVLDEGRANGTIDKRLEPAPFARLIVAALEGALMMERFVAGPAGFRGMLSALEQSMRPT